MTTALKSDSPTIRTAAILAWQAGDNTADIARLLDLTEPDVERILIGVREGRRSEGAGAATIEQTGDGPGARRETTDGAVSG
jgi:hypothetical protein